MLICHVLLSGVADAAVQMRGVCRHGLVARGARLRHLTILKLDLASRADRNVLSILPTLFDKLKMCRVDCTPVGCMYVLDLNVLSAVSVKWSCTDELSVLEVSA